MFFSSVVFELISLTNKGMITRIANRSHIGEVDGSLIGIAALGIIIGPILFGLLIDSINITNAYIVITAITLVSLFILIKERKHLKS